MQDVVNKNMKKQDKRNTFIKTLDSRIIRARLYKSYAYCVYGDKRQVGEIWQSNGSCERRVKLNVLGK